MNKTLASAQKEITAVLERHGVSALIFLALPPKALSFYHFDKKSTSIVVEGAMVGFTEPTTKNDKRFETGVKSIVTFRALATGALEDTDKLLGLAAKILQ